MAVQGQKKEFALDSNILFDLAAEKDFAHAFREGYQERGYSLRVPPTVIQELTYYAVVRSKKGARRHRWRLRLCSKCVIGICCRSI
jgi:predicted nucleic acid-binding protein